MILAGGLGVAIGTVLGVFGAGGSVLAVPVLIYVVGLSPYAATTASLGVVLASAGSALVGHARAARVRWGTAGLLGAVGIAGTVPGALTSHALSPQAAELAFAALLVAVALLMFRSPAETAGEEDSADGAAEDTGAGEGARRRSYLVKVALTGVVLGFVTGLFGVGGGFLIVPALVLVLKFDARIAAGTSLVVIMINSVSALAVRLGQPVSWDWGPILSFLVGAVVGGAVGARVADRLTGARLQRAFAVLLLAVAGYMAYRGLSG